jgi:DNA-binding transcriptional ArsR family regulator
VILWDSGTAYDFFASLEVIHAPAEYGLRASWAAGIRSRLTPQARELFSHAVPGLTIPLLWLYAMPAPKTPRFVLDRLEAADPAEILPALALNPEKPDPCHEILRGISARGAWTPGDRDGLLSRSECLHLGKLVGQKEDLDRWLDAWARPREFGVAFRSALREFYEVFFREEERRIAGDVERGLERARELASRLPVEDLFEELSQGIRMAEYLTKETLVLVPCYWCSPRIVSTELAEGRLIVMFGCRPPEASLIPGDAVPARLLLALEALSDPTRLSILRAMIAEPLTQAEIARRLRLRPPTISHHIKSLRIAGLVAYIGTGAGETRYAARVQQVDALCGALKEFLEVRTSG